MKKLIAITALAGGVLLLLVPRYLLPTCEHEGYGHMHCSDTALAEYVVGGLLAAIGGAAFFVKKAGPAMMAAVACMILFGVSFALPDIIGYCRNPRMPCNYGTIPGVRFIAVTGAIVMIVALYGLVRSAKRKGNA
jgi:hypothetical protein